MEKSAGEALEPRVLSVRAGAGLLVAAGLVPRACAGGPQAAAPAEAPPIVAQAPVPSR